MAEDELAEINGVKPKVLLLDGEEREVNSMTRNQSAYPVNARTCKHLKSLFGEAYEVARLNFKNPDGPTLKKAVSKSKPKAATSGTKRKKVEERDDDDPRPTKRTPRPSSTSKPASCGKAKSKDNEEQDNDDEDEDDPVTFSKSVPDLLLAVKWDLKTGIDPAGWWISEKLDGVRTFYDGKQLISRLGNPFTPPKWFLDKLPQDVTLDGELFGGRGEFQSTVSVVKTINSPHWKNITFQIFDIPSQGDKPFEQRIEILTKLFGPGGSHASKRFRVVDHEVATSKQHVLNKLQEIESLGGEGLMLRQPGSKYEGGRSSSLLKIKTFYDAEAVVIGYLPGKGRHQGSTGSLKCKMESGKTFNVGTGLNDKQRKHPPKIGTIITYRFQELTRDGVPRFPSYLGEAADKDKPKDAKVVAKAKPADD
ncbi:hypothetical protein H0H81_003889 [Sphagnurus paluster]|uniref:ATP-dependent DNA ligase family profile domain-containing protein n=1 Tax=Sphagnurus paluster TaxID=117069 RepID=A0A9P7GMD4_9AGAR|nr:hypothetical protein H0H81_003889 [Sphagnurus paluster]